MATRITQIKEIKYATVTYAGNMSVTYDEGIDNIIRNKSDDDLGARTAKATSASVTGTITGIDRQVYGKIPKGGNEPFEFTGISVATGEDVVTTITNTMMLKLNGSLEHDGDGGSSLSFEAFYADGKTSPVTISEPV